MLQNGSIILIAMLYIAFLFVIAWFGDRGRLLSSQGKNRRERPAIYALSLAVYCTSWTFFGSVGLATTSGLEFVSVYLGPAIFFLFGSPLLRRIVQIAKSQRIASMADFVGARYGKSSAVAVVAAFIAVAGTIPYIALQLKAVANSLEYMVLASDSTSGVGNISAYVAIAMTVFAILFGTRHADVTEHQDGMMAAVAIESVIKLVCFIALGIFVTYGVFGSFSDLWAAAEAAGVDVENMSQVQNWQRFIVISLLSVSVFILLPRVFHVAVVESRSDRELNRAIILFPLYLVAINLFVVPIAVAGLTQFGSSVDADIFVLALPLQAESPLFAMVAFIGGLSAATAMVIVATVALSITISNDLVVPFLLRQTDSASKGVSRGTDMMRNILLVRRTAIFAVILLAFIYYRTAGEAALAAIGLMSFVAIMQIAPAFFGGLFWRRANARGAIASMMVGFFIWNYTLLLPTLIGEAHPLLTHGPFGIEWLKPTAMFGWEMDPLIHGFIMSLTANILTFIVASNSRPQNYIERVQATIFIPRSSSSLIVRHKGAPVSVGEVRMTVGGFLGFERTDRSFNSFFSNKGTELADDDQASDELLIYAEQLLTSAIGSSSARLVLSLMLGRHEPNTADTMQLLDDASVGIQYNRDLLQAALEEVEQGLTVFDRSSRLICWNKRFRTLLNLPPSLGEVGTEMQSIYDELYNRGDLVGLTWKTFRERIMRTGSPWKLRLRNQGKVFEIVSNAMPDGGIVTTYSDISLSEQYAAELSAAKESLELRVANRTNELTKLNEALTAESQRADEANRSKTHFLAAAGHDILQPLNAARLYNSFISEKATSGDLISSAENLALSLDAVEEILGAVLAISKLDSGHWRPNFSTVAIAPLFAQLRAEFLPIAEEKGLTLNFHDTNVHVRTDRTLLKRLLQNLISNAIKYTDKGQVLVGVRLGHLPLHHDKKNLRPLKLCVYDTGPGIEENDQKIIFKEFSRLPGTAKTAKGLGLGLSIVERIAVAMNTNVELKSQMNLGSCFSVMLPAAQKTTKEETVAAKATDVAEDWPDGLVVLCIDNDAQILLSMAKLLENWGCKVLKAETLNEARSAISEHGTSPDIILADYHIEDDDGLSVTQQLWEDAGQNIPCALVTADRSKETEASAKNIGALVLYKPVNPLSLKKTLSQLAAAANSKTHKKGN